MDNRQVALDTDFICCITNFRGGSAVDLFFRLFQALNLTPVVHPYIAQFELMHNKTAQELMHSDSLKVIHRSEFLPSGDDVSLRHYRQSFADLYPKVTKSQVLPNDLDIWTSNAKMSLGETHTILMSVELGIPLFYSNDGGAKRGATYYRAGRLQVYNAEEVAALLVSSTLISGKERRFLRHYRTRP